MTSKVFDQQSGNWNEGKAAPKLLPDELRALPSDYVTSDIEDTNRVHELDPEHVRLSLVDDRIDAETRPTAEPEQNLPSLPRNIEWVPCTQENIDLIRLRVTKILVDANYHKVSWGEPPDNRIRHVWFHENDINGTYELRMGNAPPSGQRPKHLKWKHLEIDPCKMPETLMRRIMDDKSLRDSYEKHIKKANEMTIVGAEGGVLYG